MTFPTHILHSLRLAHSYKLSLSTSFSFTLLIVRYSWTRKCLPRFKQLQMASAGLIKIPKRKCMNYHLNGIFAGKMHTFISKHLSLAAAAALATIQFAIYDNAYRLSVSFFGQCVVVSLFNGTIIMIVFLWVVILWRLFIFIAFLSRCLRACVLLDSRNLFTFKPFVSGQTHCIWRHLWISLQAAYIEIKRCFIPLNSSKNDEYQKRRILQSINQPVIIAHSTCIIERFF